MSEEKDLKEFTEGMDSDADNLNSFVDFTDLADLDHSDALDDLGDLGELGDLDDLSDLPDISDLDDLTDVAAPDASAVADVSIDEVQESDSPAGLFEEDSIPSDLPVLEDITGLDDTILPEEMPEITPDDMIKGDLLSENQEVDNPVITNTVMPETTDELPVLDDFVMEEPAMEESGFADPVLEEPVLMDSITEESAVTEPVLDSLESELPKEEEPVAANEQDSVGGLDSMLSGILGDLDLGDSFSESSEAPADAAADDLLGTDEIPFTGDSFGDALNMENLMPEQPKEEEKKPGFFKKVFGNVITDEIAEAERKQAQEEKEAKEKLEEEEAKKKEEKEAEKEAKKQEKARKAEEKKKAKEARKAEKKAQKEEAKAKQEEEEAAELEIVGKLNRTGVIIIAIATVLFLAIEIGGTNLFGSYTTKKAAVNYFSLGKYTDAYEEAIGTNLKEKDRESYDKIKTVMKVQYALDSYQSYERMKYYPEALNALLKGIKRYDDTIEDGVKLNVDGDMMKCRNRIISTLQQEFALSESEAYAILALDKDSYTKRVVKIGLNKK